MSTPDPTGTRCFHQSIRRYGVKSTARNRLGKGPNLHSPGRPTRAWRPVPGRRITIVDPITIPCAARPHARNLRCNGRTPPL
jgi:hypothetical protein